MFQITYESFCSFVTSLHISEVEKVQFSEEKGPGSLTNLLGFIIWALFVISKLFSKLYRDRGFNIRMFQVHKNPMM